MPAHPALRPMAPLLGLAVAEAVLEALLGDFEVLDAVKGDDVGLDDPEDVGPIGAVDCPAISDEIDALKVPVILSRVNL